MYGVHLNIPPVGDRRGLGVDKYVMLHRRCCAQYKKMLRRGMSRGRYSHHRNAQSFREALAQASRWTLEWHAPIKMCQRCISTNVSLTT